MSDSAHMLGLVMAITMQSLFWLVVGFALGWWLG